MRRPRSIASWVALAVLIACAAAMPGYAQEPSLSCQIIPASEAPEPIRALAHEAGEFCSTPGGMSWDYTALSPVELGALGACKYFTGFAFAYRDGEWHPLEQQNREPRAFIALPENGICPFHGDDAYIAAAGFSEGVFLELSGFLNALRTSPDAFDAGFDFASAYMPETPEIYAGMRDALTAGEGAVYRLAAIRSNPFAATGYIPGYRLTLRTGGDQATLTAYFLNAERVNGAWKILHYTCYNFCTGCGDPLRQAPLP